MLRTIILTSLALIAFAANSVLCRLALGEGAIDASSFTVIRLLSGAIVLFTIIQFNKIKPETSTAETSFAHPSTKGSWSASFMLFLYAITFSFAYTSLHTGTGALILFGSVQITMILLSLISGNRLHLTEWIGVIISLLGFVYLVLPGVTAPSVPGFLLMTVAGMAWGTYSLKGRISKNPLTDTGYNFIRSLPFICVVAIFTLNSMDFSLSGVLLAVLSGTVASGIGYAIWYSALGGLSTTQAAVVQLLVPVIAAIGGIIFISETITLRLAISALLILGGILIISAKPYFDRRHLMKKN